MSQSERRVVITGMGLISPIGNSLESMWDHLSAGKSGVAELRSVPVENFTTDIGGECRDFDGGIDNFGTPDKLLKRNIKKALKLMCREIQIGVAAAQLAIENAGLVDAEKDPSRIGTMFGSDYIITSPNEYSSGIAACLSEDGKFNFEKWATQGIPKVEPTWLLKYLPNMPASHVAIFNDLQGPSNSLTVREASSNIAIGEAVTIIRRGSADIMVTGSTGSRIHPLRTIHVCLQEQLADRHSDVAGGDAAKACRPFDANRSGMVMGEGAGVMVIESLESAQSRGAEILGEVIGYGSSAVTNTDSTADYFTAISNTIHSALEVAGVKADSIGHVHAHGLGGLRCDEEEAAAIAGILGDTPVTAAKSYMGNLGAGSGMVEAIASVTAIHKDELFPVLNCQSIDPKCKINVATSATQPGDSFINLNVTPQGQASAVIIKRPSN
jgi:3-oxoacyl-[acyl-carrier-protein] synthase II